MFRQLRGRVTNDFLQWWQVRAFGSDINISIDRAGLLLPPENFSDGPAPSSAGDLVDHIKALIRFRGGPITVAEYMAVAFARQQALTHPQAGYYSTQQAFGRRGDFITSPDISQLFGEMLGVWCVLAWQNMGQPKAVRLVEMGPGRGTLMSDLLRSTAVFPAFASALRVSLVEVSARLRQQQAVALACPETDPVVHAGSFSKQQSELGARPEVTWHASLDEVPQDAPLLLLAHEFFDALPVHQFRKTPLGWREVLVDVPVTHNHPHPLRFVLSPGPTPASHMLLSRRLNSLPLDMRAGAEALEVSGMGMAAAQQMAKRVGAQGGAALVIDYGQASPYPSSLQGVVHHKAVHPLASPGKADLSCRVDFSSLRQGVEESGAPATSWGPIPQGPFLQDLGIAARLEALIKACPEQEQALFDGAMRLVAGTTPRPPALSTPPTICNPPRVSSEPQQGGRGGVAGSAGVEGEVGDESGHGQGDGMGEGMGYEYMAMAICPADQAPHFPFGPG